MSRPLYLAALVLTLLTCLSATPVQDLAQLASDEDAQAAGQHQERDDVAEVFCSEDNTAPHTGLKKRCIGKERKLRWLQWGRKESKALKDKVTTSIDSLIAAEQQRHLTNLHMISQILDPEERQEAEAAESERRQQKEIDFSGMQ